MKITTYNPTTPRSEFEFYILNKGYNAGKPLHHPCPNCFTCQASSLEEKELYYWLCFGLWQGQAFRPYLIGSVIPFIRLNDLLQVLNHSGIQAIAEPAAFKVLVDTLNLLESREKVMKNTLTLLGEAKRATVHHYLTRH